MATAKDAPLDRFDRAATWESFRETIESFYDKGWTDGLPVIPPTEDAVAEMMAAVDRDPAEVIGIVPPRQGVATIESLAANAVMAGCKPAVLPGRGRGGRGDARRAAQHQRGCRRRPTPARR